jgi:hypothetical protein
LLRVGLVQRGLLRRRRAASILNSLGSLVEITDGKVSLSQKLGLITEHWRPKVVGELNGQDVKLAKFQGTFVWYHHEHERSRAL